MNVKVSVTPKSAWDEITQQATTMSFLDTLNKFNPDIKITPDILASIMSITNDHIPKITQNLEKSACRKFFGKSMCGTGKQLRNLPKNIPKANPGLGNNQMMRLFQLKKLKDVQLQLLPM